MRIGDTLTLEPTMALALGLGRGGPRPCRVVYVHPQRRFFTVEFTSDVTGERWRESIFIPARER